MKRCDQCGAEYENDSYAFCPSCGGDLIEVVEGEEEESVNVCGSCGAVLVDDYEFCPECGKPVDKNTVHTSTVKIKKDSKAQSDHHADDVSVYRSSSSFSQPANPSTSSTPKKKVSKKTIIIAAIVFFGLAVLIMCMAMCSSSTTVLTVNGDETLNMELGEGVEISDIKVEGQGLTDEDLKNATWTTDDEYVAKVESGKIVATADPGDLYEKEDGTMSGTANITVTIDNNNGKWEGFVPVEVTAKASSFENKEIILKPEGSRDSYVTIEPSKYDNMIFYLKSKDDSDNNMAFYAEKGADSFDMDIPMNNYEVYVASGNKWYGDKAKFGEYGNYYKYTDPIDFANYTYKLTLSEMGNPDKITTWYDMTSLDWDKFPKIK